MERTITAIEKEQLRGEGAGVLEMRISRVEILITRGEMKAAKIGR